MKKYTKKCLDRLTESVYDVNYDYDWDENLVVEYERLDDKLERHLVNPIKRLIESYPVWQPFEFDEEGNLCGPMPDCEEEVLISDGYSVIVDLFTNDGEGYYLDNSNWDLEGLAWMPIPKPYSKSYELAKEINDFMSDEDPVAYNETVGKNSKDTFIKGLKEQIENNNTKFIVDYLTSVIEGTWSNEIFDRATELLERVKAVKH